MNKKVAEILYCAQMDDLVDARKLAECATELSNLGETSLASNFVSRAKTRLNQVAECEHTIKNYTQRIRDEKIAQGYSVEDDNIFEELYKKHVMHEVEKIKKMLETM